MIHVRISIFNNPSTNTSESSPKEGERSKVQRAAATRGQVGAVQVIGFRNTNTPLRAHRKEQLGWIMLSGRLTSRRLGFVLLLRSRLHASSHSSQRRPAGEGASPVAAVLASTFGPWLHHRPFSEASDEIRPGCKSTADRASRPGATGPGGMMSFFSLAASLM